MKYAKPFIARALCGSLSFLFYKTVPLQPLLLSSMQKQAAPLSERVTPPPVFAH